jgi:uncharacterized protein (DUF433 family)
VKNRSQWQGRGMGIDQLIVKTPGTCGGRARIAGRRIAVSSVYRWFLSGQAPEDILGKYEGLSLAEIYAAIAYALSNREEIAAEIEEEDQLERASRPSPVPTS